MKANSFESRFEAGVAVCILLIFLIGIPAAGQTSGEGPVDSGGLEKAVMELTGASCAEDIGPGEMERFEDLYARPLRINFASRSRLVGSGLFSQYQVATLADYIARNGDILSLAELAAVDGFTPESAQALAPFVSFMSDALPGRRTRERSPVHNSFTARSAVKLQEGDAGGEAVCQYSYGVKYMFSLEDRFEAAFTCRSSYGKDLFPPEASSFYAAYYGRGALGKIVIGDFNARFGQGLAMWSGFSMSGVPSQGAFSKRPSGISPYWSYSGDGSHRGVAADFSAGRLMISAFASFPGSREVLSPGADAALSFLPGLNVAWSGMDGQVSVTCYASSGTFYAREKGVSASGMSGGPFFRECRVSADARYSVRGVEVFSEAALDAARLSAAALAGCKFSIGDSFFLASGVRYYPAGYDPGYAGAIRSGSKCTNEYGASVSGSFLCGKYVQLQGRTGFGSSAVRHQGSFSLDISHAPSPKYGVDAASSQLKAVFSYRCQLSGAWSIQCRILERMRTYAPKSRTDMRCDIAYSTGVWSASLRLNVLRSTGISLLSYAECGCRSGKFYIYARCGIFRADNWDDRIYAYERDAPGNFSVPAFYGRGFWSSAAGRISLFKRGKLYLRTSYTGYPWLSPSSEKKKPGKAELKLQFVLDM